jgi:hypothetical protein
LIAFAIFSAVELLENSTFIIISVIIFVEVSSLVIFHKQNTVLDENLSLLFISYRFGLILSGHDFWLISSTVVISLQSVFIAISFCEKYLFKLDHKIRVAEQLLSAIKTTTDANETNDLQSLSTSSSVEIKISPQKEKGSNINNGVFLKDTLNSLPSPVDKAPANRKVSFFSNLSASLGIHVSIHLHVYLFIMLQVYCAFLTVLGSFQVKNIALYKISTRPQIFWSCLVWLLSFIVIVMLFLIKLKASRESQSVSSKPMTLTSISSAPDITSIKGMITVNDLDNVIKSACGHSAMHNVLQGISLLVLRGKDTEDSSGFLGLLLIVIWLTLASIAILVSCFYSSWYLVPLMALLPLAMAIFQNFILKWSEHDCKYDALFIVQG